MRVRTFLAVMVTALLLGRGISNAIMVSLSIEDLTKASNLIIKGKVKNSASHWRTDNKIIFTRVEIKVTSVVRGKLTGSTVFLEYEGGEADGRVLRVSDAPELAIGGEVIVFLNKVASMRFSGDAYQIYGSAQGLYHINPSTGVATRHGFLLAPGLKGEDNKLIITEIINRVGQVK